MIEKRESLRERAKKRTVKSEHKTLGFRGCLYIWLASLVAQTVKSPHAMQETQVQSLDQEDSLEKEMATHSSILAWRIPWTEEPGRPQSVELQRVRHDQVTNTFTSASVSY